jgi:2-keto-4-pentenoate hydratase
MGLSEEIKRVVAEALYWAEVRREPIEPLTDRYPELTVREAYEIQLLVVRRKMSEGARVVGKKIGLTSPAMQRMLGVDQPDYGHLLDRMQVAEGGMIECARLIQPRVEGEIAFLLKRDLVGPGVGIEHVVAATEAVVPALEVIDSRIREWRIRLADTIADNASSGLFVLGEPWHRVEEFDLTEVEMSLRCRGEEVLRGRGEAVLGHPARAVAWLANALAELGTGLKAGEIVLSGSLGAARAVQPGDLVEADFGAFGRVSVHFV